MKYLLVGLGLAIAIAAAAAWAWLPVQYEAFALLRVADKSPTVLAAPAASPEEVATFRRTQVQLMLSNLVLKARGERKADQRAAERGPHGEDAPAWLRESLVIDYPDESEVMRVVLALPNGDNCWRSSTRS